MGFKSVFLAWGCAALLGCGENTLPDTDAAALASHDGEHDNGHVRHVLLISVDGLHPFDLDNYIVGHPASALARLKASGLTYTNAYAAAETDSFPATLAMVTGGSPASTGVYYDTTWDDNLSPVGSNCSTRGALVAYKENVNVDPNDGSLGINPAKLPRDPDHGCTPVYPHQYLRVNTIYEVIKAAGMRTAAADKHPSYEMLHGPSGTGVDDLFTPEINPVKTSISGTMLNDEKKVVAVLNQLDGYASTDNSHATRVGVPGILGMNFQAINIGQKFSGYADAAGTPVAGTPAAPGLAESFDYVDGALDRIMTKIAANGLSKSTVIILGAKHGNSPVDRTQLTYINTATAITARINSVQPGLAAQVTADGNALIWLKDHTKAAAVAAVLQANATAVGAGNIYTQDEIDTLFDGQLGGNPGRRPDIMIEPFQGVLYAAPGSKLADHGGWHEESRHVALVISGHKYPRGTAYAGQVNLAQLAPTILDILRLNKNALTAVVQENVQSLPKPDDDDDDNDGHDD